MQFNPYINKAEQASIDNSSVAALTRLMSEGLKDVGSGIQEFGDNRRSSKVAKLIGSGTLDGMSEEQARAEIAKVSEGSINKETASSVDALLKGKNVKDVAGQKMTFDQKMQQLRLDQTAQLAKEQNANAMAVAKEHTAQSNQNQFQQRELQRELEAKRLQNALAMKKLGLPTESTFDKQSTTALVKQIDADKNFMSQATQDVAAVHDEDNWFFDAEFDSKKDKQIVDEVMYQAQQDPEGRRMLFSKDKYARESYLNKKLKEKGLVLDQGMFGALKIKKKGE